MAGWFCMRFACKLRNPKFVCINLHMAENEVLSAYQAARRMGISRRALLYRVQKDQVKPLAKLPGTTGSYLFDADYIESIAAKERAATDGTRALAANTQEVA